MKVLKHGTFLERKIEPDWENWDNMPIGFHASYRNQMRENAKTAVKRYFWINPKGETIIVRNPRFLEKVIARLNPCKAKIAGYDRESKFVDTTKDIDTEVEM